MIGWGILEFIDLEPQLEIATPGEPGLGFSFNIIIREVPLFCKSFGVRKYEEEKNMLGGAPPLAPPAPLIGFKAIQV